MDLKKVCGGGQKKFERIITENNPTLVISPSTPCASSVF
jgi:hypothetical protein